MEARGYTGGTGRTRRARLRARPADYVALAAAVLYCILMLRIDFSALDRALVTWLAGL
jgi:energy-coupling factor transporter transmembrane protein EcfT